MSTNTTEPVVSMDEVRVHFENQTGFFSDPETVRAVDGISLDIHENEVIALVGESGCGKTTLGKAAIGLEQVTDGHVEYRGQDIWKAKNSRRTTDPPFSEIRRALQIVHQDPGSSLNPNLTVMGGLDLPLRKWHDDLTAADRRARVMSMLEQVGMTPPEDYMQRYPHQLSGGEKQRIALIRALMMEPDLILADEAISALDVSLRVEMMDLMLDLQDMFDTAFLFVSHDLSNARYICEKADGRIGVMYLGELVEIGSTEEIVTDPQHPYTQALRWATPKLRDDNRGDEMPIRTVDIPDPTNPPGGCRYHTRCPKAREVCRAEIPQLFAPQDSRTQRASCFRLDETHEYWNSDPIDDRTDTQERE
jgi:peptide/nickel transport system ATP-binding protein